MNIQPTSMNLYNKQPQFTGKLSRLYVKMVNPPAKIVAKRLGKIAEKAPTEKLMSFINKHPKIENNLFSHLIVLGSTIMSGFYVTKTLTNKKLDKDRRKTLAINQGLVYLASTTMAYTFDSWAKDLYKAKVVKPFMKANEHLPKVKLNKLEAGLRNARQIVIFDLMYRFIAPVAITPLANYIGNKLQEHKAAKSQQKSV